MELHFSLEQMARLQEAARALARQSANQVRNLHAVLADAELDLHQGSPAQRVRQRNAVAIARQLCLDAREHQVAIERIMVDLGVEPAAERLHPTVVLVADDHLDSREWLSAMLHGAGFVVQTATNGLEAVLAAHQLRPAVIVMDLGMPILDGIEATRLIKAADDLRASHVIAYTAAPFTHPVFSDGLFTAILPKPSPADQVVATVQRCLRTGLK